MIKTFIMVFVSFTFAWNASSRSFPQRCEGNWKGTMHIWSKGQIRDSVDVVFTVAQSAEESGRWIWKTEYLSEKMPMVKNYTLIEKAESSNEYLLDEGDGVVVTNYVFGNKMYSNFKVGKNWLTASYELIDELLIFEVSSGVVSKEKTTGVTNYTIDFLQRVELLKMH